MAWLQFATLYYIRYVVTVVAQLFEKLLRNYSLPDQEKYIKEGHWPINFFSNSLIRWWHKIWRQNRTVKRNLEGSILFLNLLSVVPSYHLLPVQKNFLKKIPFNSQGYRELFSLLSFTHNSANTNFELQIHPQGGAFPGIQIIYKILQFQSLHKFYDVIR